MLYQLVLLFSLWHFLMNLNNRPMGWKWQDYFFIKSIQRPAFATSIAFQGFDKVVYAQESLLIWVPSLQQPLTGMGQIRARCHRLGFVVVCALANPVFVSSSGWESMNWLTWLWQKGWERLPSGPVDITAGRCQETRHSIVCSGSHFRESRLCCCHDKRPWCHWRTVSQARDGLQGAVTVDPVHLRTG